MADDKKTAEEFKGLTKGMVDGFKSLVAESKERAAVEARERAKNSDEVKFAIQEQGTRQRKLQEQGLSAEQARYQAQKDTMEIVNKQTDLIKQNNPALTILQPLKMLADGAKAGVKSAAAQVEERRKNFRLQESLLNGITSVEKGIVGVATTFGNAVKEKAQAFGGGLKSILGKLLIGGALAAFVAFMNSPYWEKMKAIISEKIVPALTYVFDNVIKPLWDEGLSFIFKQFETIGNLFSGIGDAITLFKEGKILEGITTLVGSLGTFFKDTIDNLFTAVYNLFGGLFGLEKTDSVFGSISKFFSDTWTSIKTFFTDLYNGVVGIFTDPVGTLTSLWNGLVGEGGLIDIIFTPIDAAIAWIQGIFGWGNPEEPFSLGEFIRGAFTQVKDWFVGIFTWGAEAGKTEAGDFSITKLALEGFKKVKEWISNLFSWADSTKPEGEDAEWTLLGSILEAVKAPIRFLRDLFTFDTDFFEKDLLSQLGIVSAKLVDLVFYPLNLAVNFVKGLFGWDVDEEGNKTTFSISGLIGDVMKKIGDFFSKLFDIDIRGLASSFMPETVVDFLFGKEVDQTSAEFQSMSGLDQAKATGLYDHDRIGNSEINRNLIAGASEKQLQAILDHDDLSKDDRDFVKAEMARRSGAGEFSGTGKPAELNAYQKKMQKIEAKKAKIQGDDINKSSAEAAAEKERAQQVVMAIQQHPREAAMANRQTPVALPIPTKDFSSSAGQTAAVTQ